MIAPLNRLAAGLACAFAAHVAAAQDTLGEAAGTCLGLPETLALSAERDPGVGLARAERQSAEAALMDARALSRPQLSAFGRTAAGDQGLTDNAIENQVGLRASQRVFDFGDARLAREASREALGASEEDIEAARLQAAEATGVAYLNLLETAARLEATRDRERYFVEQLAAIEQLLGRGGATLPDRAEVAAELADARAARLELQFLIERFATRVSLDTERVVAGASALCEGALAAAFLDGRTETFQSSEALADQALAANPAVRGLERSIRSLDADRRREARARLPVIDVVGVISYTYDDVIDDFETRDRIGVDVSVPLYSGNAFTARNQRAQAEVAAARSRLRAAERRLREQVQVTHRRILSLQAQSARRDEAMARKAEQFDAAERERERGLRTLPDVVEIRLELEASMLAAIQTRFDLMRERLALLALSGRLLERGDREP